MAEAAAENEYVLKELGPILTFDSFGDNALILNLRCYLGSLDYRWETKTALHKAINQKFNAAGIVIQLNRRLLIPRDYFATVKSMGGTLLLDHSAVLFPSDFQ